MTPLAGPNAGEILAGKYRVERVLGQGGMGMVVAATHLVLGHQVALKYLLPSAGLRAETIARFLREAQVTARLKSVHVAKTLDVGQFDDGRPFLVMELLEGRDLGAELESRRDVSVIDVVGWVLQACEGLAEAHAAGVVHRDLKPSNLFLARDPSGTPVVKVLDFGISKLVASDGGGSLTASEASFGSPLYMSPEQLRSSKSADVRSDVWSLGVILYEALSGAPPFDGESVFALAQSVMADAPRPLAERRRDVPPALSALVMRCLAKSPADRPQSVAELAQALAPFAGPGGAALAARVRPPTSDRGSDRVIVAMADSEPGDLWTAAATQRDPLSRTSLARRAVAALVVGGALGGALFLWRAGTASGPSSSPAAPLAVTAPAASADAAATATHREPARVVTPAPPAEPAPPEAADAGAAVPEPVVVRPATKRRHEASAPASSPATSASPGPFIDIRTND